ncbi:hypothetical protein SORBI_3010G017200 [Sorghum bicolor]|uniref:Uncharacterized protein n=1 Tax=Sorghum bicolor TaxID=4558 RepID=A0A194YGT9_SORBI|nr:hypothetical protein SORBI_3010G017200 [Sorghum bicolor]
MPPTISIFPNGTRTPRTRSKNATMTSPMCPGARWCSTLLLPWPVSLAAAAPPAHPNNPSIHPSPLYYIILCYIPQEAPCISLIDPIPSIYFWTWSFYFCWVHTTATNLKEKLFA